MGLVARPPQSLHLILDTQFETLDFENFTVIGRGRGKGGMKLLLQSTMLFFKGFKMSLNGHLILSFLVYLQRPLLELCGLQQKCDTKRQDCLRRKGGLSAAIWRLS